MLESRIALDGYPESLWPSLTVALPWDCAVFDEGARELVPHLEWTLDLIVSLHACTPNPNPAALPSWCILHGLVYTSHGVRIYAHFPRWNPETAEWQLFSEQVTDMYDNVFTEDSVTMMVGLASTLMTIQRHAHEVQAHLRGWLRDYGRNVLQQWL